MKLVNNNISPLPFYDSLSRQNHRKKYAFGQIYPLLMHINKILPFQVVLQKVDSQISKVYLCNANNDEKTDVTASFIENGIELKQFDNFTVLRYSGNWPITELKQEGLFYLQIDIAQLGSIYSDIFCLTNKLDDCIELEYGNDYNFLVKNGVVDFSEEFKFKCYIQSIIGKPNYNFEEEAKERMGYSFIESQVSKKVYKFTFLAPEYLCDALRIVRLCNYKKITYLGEEYDITSFSINPEWEDQGDLASVECEFETDTVIANIGGYIQEPIGGDFNNDYNSDFKTEE